MHDYNASYFLLRKILEMFEQQKWILEKVCWVRYLRSAFLEITGRWSSCYRRCIAANSAQTTDKLLAEVLYLVAGLESSILDFIAQLLGLVNRPPCRSCWALMLRNLLSLAVDWAISGYFRNNEQPLYNPLTL